MSYGNVVDAIAAFTKRGIEINGRTRDEIEWAKANIDCLSALLKLIPAIPEQRLNSIEINFEWVKQVKTSAQKWSVDSVVLFPYPVNNQSFIPLIRTYGGETEKFFAEIGFNLLNGNMITAEEKAILTQWEHEYGIILYKS